MTGPQVPLAAGRRHSLAVVDGGRVLAAGPPGAGECAVTGWSDVVAVAAGNVHTARNTGRSHSVGLRADGTVLAVGWNAHGQCDVTDWSQVVGFAAGWRRTLGVRADGTVLAAGRRDDGACDVGGAGPGSSRSPPGTGTPWASGRTGQWWRPG